jgi:RND family efflux transporter MFP subunit
MQWHEKQEDMMQESSAPSKAALHRHKHLSWLVTAVILLIAVAILGLGMLRRVRNAATVRSETSEMSIPSVSVVTPKPTAPSQELVLPGNMQPFITAPIYSRTNGYLQHWYADIGARVKQGQLLAIIATPEVDQQLRQARSNLATAQANLQLAETTKNRYQDLLKGNAVSQQEVDNAVGTYNADRAIVAANQANVKQLETLQSFEKIYAPFDGIVTARNTDVGDLINSGSTGGVKTDLFHISQTGNLRVYVSVPEQYAAYVTPNVTAELTMAEFPGKRFHGKLVRTADAINYATRTLLAEVDVGNPTGQLLSGSFVEVHLKLPGKTSTFVLPVETLLFRSEGLRVAVVKDSQVVLTPIVPGHDFGAQIEIVSGLKGDEQVITNPPDSIASGQRVQVAQAAQGSGVI